MVAAQYTGADPPGRPARPHRERHDPDVPPDALPEVTVKAIRRLLADRGVSQHAVAGELSVTDATFSRWLARKQGMPMATVEWLAGRLGVPLEALFREPRAGAAPAEGVLTLLLERLDSLRRSLRALPLYRYGAPGNPRTAAEGELGPLAYQQVPPGYDALVGQRGFALVVEAEDASGRGVYPGDVVIGNPDGTWSLGGLVVALVEGRLVVREMGLDPEGRTVARTAPEAGPPTVTAGDAFVVVAPVVLALAVSPLPEGRGNARERPPKGRPGGETWSYIERRGVGNDGPRVDEKP